MSDRPIYRQLFIINIRKLVVNIREIYINTYTCIYISDNLIVYLRVTDFIEMKIDHNFMKNEFIRNERWWRMSIYSLVQVRSPMGLIKASNTTENGSTEKAASVSESLNGVAESSVGRAVGSVAAVAAAWDEAVYVADCVYQPPGHGDDRLYYLFDDSDASVASVTVATVASVAAVAATVVLCQGALAGQQNTWNHTISTLAIES